MTGQVSTREPRPRTEQEREAAEFLAKFAEFPPQMQEIGLAFLRGIQYGQRTRPSA